MCADQGTAWARGTSEVYRGVELRNYRGCPYDVIDQVIDFTVAVKHAPVKTVVAPAYAELGDASCAVNSAFFVYLNSPLPSYHYQGYHDAGLEAGGVWIKGKATSDVPYNLTPKDFFLVRMTSGNMILTGKNQFSVDITGQKKLLPRREIDEILNQIHLPIDPPYSGTLRINVMSDQAVEVTFNPVYNGIKTYLLKKLEGEWRRVVSNSAALTTRDGYSVRVLGEPVITEDDVEAIVEVYHQEEVRRLPAAEGDLVIEVLSPKEVTVSTNASHNPLSENGGLHHQMKLKGVWKKTLITPVTVISEKGVEVTITGLNYLTMADVEAIIAAYYSEDDVPIGTNRLLLKVTDTGASVSSGDGKNSVGIYNFGGSWIRASLHKRYD
ncbi:MAG: hypothetical protein KC897_04145 [Candidatus Omnitrophica bacterium]|nr:hypothetical protein [Candidatus Omnitrophota bacterium]MCB9721877.1 hypothetical protein [Candidatus Omnitrophota bacterium]